MGTGRTAVVLCVIALGAAAAGPASAQDTGRPGEAAAAADAETLAIQRDFAALVRRAEFGPQWGDDSPTAIVNRLVSADAAKLRAVCAAAWQNAAPRFDEDNATGPVRWSIGLLFERITESASPATRGRPLVAPDGVVRIPIEQATWAFCGTLGPERHDELLFSRAIGDAKPIARTAPRAADVVAAVIARGAAVPAAVPADRAAEAPRSDRPRCDRCRVTDGRDAPGIDWPLDSASWHCSPELDDEALLAGELCRSDVAARATLAAAARAPDAGIHLITALAASRDPEAVPIIEARLRAVLASDDAGHEPRLGALLRALDRADPAAFRRFVGAQDAAMSDLLIAAAGIDRTEDILCRGLDAPAAASARIAALDRIAAVAPGSIARRRHERSRRIAPLASGSTLGRLLARVELARRAAEPDVRAAADRAAQALTADRVFEGERADWLRPRIDVESAAVTHYPSLATSLDALREELAAGRLTFEPAAADPFDPGVRSRRRTIRVAGVATEQDGVADPRRGTVGDPRDYTEWGHTEIDGLRLEGTMTPAGLVLTLTNGSDEPIALNPVALRFVRAEIRRERFKADDPADPAAPRWRTLHLVFGAFGPPASVPASSLVVIEPGRRHSWTTPLRDEDRDADQIAVTFADRLRIRGEPPARVLLNAQGIWVR